MIITLYWAKGLNMGLNGASSFQVNADLMRAKVKEYSAKLSSVENQVKLGKAKPEELKSVEDGVDAFTAMVKVGDSNSFQETSDTEKNLDGKVKQQNSLEQVSNKIGRVNPKPDSSSLGRDGDNRFLASA